VNADITAACAMELHIHFTLLIYRNVEPSVDNHDLYDKRL